MSNDMNYISPNYNGLDRLLEPLPELDSDEVYMERRKARELELLADKDYLRDEAIPDNLSDSFMESLSCLMLNQDATDIEAVILTAETFVILLQDIQAHVEQQAKEDIES